MVRVMILRVLRNRYCDEHAIKLNALARHLVHPSSLVLPTTTAHSRLSLPQKFNQTTSVELTHTFREGIFGFKARIAGGGGLKAPGTWTGVQ